MNFPYTLLPKSCKEYLGFQEELNIVNFCKNFSSVIYKMDFYDFEDYQPRPYWLEAVIYDITISAGELLHVTHVGDLSMCSFKQRHSLLAIYDVMLAFYEVWCPKQINRLVKLEHMLLLYNMSLRANLKDPDFADEIINLGSFCNIPLYIYSDGSRKKGLEFLFELLSLCYCAAFFNRISIDDVCSYYDKYYKMLYSISNVASGSCRELQECYITDFEKTKKSIGCEGIDLLEVNFDPYLFLLLVRHLTVKICKVRPELQSMSYVLFRECRPVNEVKAQQAAIMILKAFQSSGGIKKGTAHGIVMKLLFGNFIERNLMLRLFDVAYIASCKSTDDKSKTDLMEKFVDWSKTILNELEYMEDKLSIDCSEQEVESLDLKSCGVYNRVGLTIDGYAKDVGVSLEDLEKQRNEKFEVGFVDILSHMTKCDIPGIIVSPCNGLNRVSCEIVIQLCSSYIYSYDENMVVEGLLSARLYSVGFLFFNVLTCPRLADDFASLYCDSSLKDSTAIRSKFTAVLTSFNRSVSEDSIYSSQAVYRDTGFIGEVTKLFKTNTPNKAVDEFIRTSLIIGGIIHLNYKVLRDIYSNIVKVRNLSHYLSVEDVQIAYADPKVFYLTSTVLLQIFSLNADIKMLELYGSFLDGNRNYIVLSNNQGNIDRLGASTGAMVVLKDDQANERSKVGTSSTDVKVIEEDIDAHGGINSKPGKHSEGQGPADTEEKNITDSYLDEQQNGDIIASASSQANEHSKAGSSSTGIKVTEKGIDVCDGLSNYITDSSSHQTEMHLQEGRSSIDIAEQETHYGEQKGSLVGNTRDQVEEHVGEEQSTSFHQQSGDLTVGSSQTNQHSEGQGPVDTGEEGKASDHDGQSGVASTIGQADIHPEEDPSSVSAVEQGAISPYDGQDGNLTSSATDQTMEHSVGRTDSLRVTDGQLEPMSDKKQFYCYIIISVFMLSAASILAGLAFSNQSSNLFIESIGIAAACFILSAVFCAIAITKNNLSESILETPTEGETVTHETQVSNIDSFNFKQCK
ncbi:hypothetical protein K6025_04820 [Ehrlichia sp. JZT12]